MKLPFETPVTTATPATATPNLVESALRKYVRNGLRVCVLFTRPANHWVKFTGLLEEEARALERAGYAVVLEEMGHRLRVGLTAQGLKARDALTGRPAATGWGAKR